MKYKKLTILAMVLSGFFYLCAGSNLTTHHYWSGAYDLAFGIIWSCMAISYHRKWMLKKAEQVARDIFKQLMSGQK